MLGYDVTAYHSDDQGTRHNLVRWSAHNLDWINALVQQGRASMVQDSGGYPYIYELVAGELRSVLADEDSAKRMALRTWPGPALEKADDKDDVLSRCRDDATVTVEAWDQS
ncbi:hypothetical protein ABIE18_004444 [Arthrobacter sp. 2762]